MTATPTTVSECPPRYFVAEWNTTSAPSSSGRWIAGEANVLSITSSGGGGRPAPPARWRIAAAAAMSVTLSSGFDGVSSQTRRVALGQALPQRVRGPRRGPRSVADAAPAGRWTARGSGTCRRTRRRRRRSPRPPRRAARWPRSPPTRRRTRSRARRPRGPRPPARAARGSGSATARTRSRRAAARRRPGRRSRSGRSAARRRRSVSSGSAPAWTARVAKASRSARSSSMGGHDRTSARGIRHPGPPD